MTNDRKEILAKKFLYLRREGRMIQNNELYFKKIHNIMDNFKNIYQIKVTLEGIYPRIWRRIQTFSNITLDELHKILQIVFGWNDEHLYIFMMEGTDYGIPDEEEDYDIGDTLDSRTVKLYQMGQRILNAKMRDEKIYFEYRYDFGDKWDHEIIIENCLPIKEGKYYPVCLTGKRACPPENIGGAWSYNRFLKIIKDPTHPEYQEVQDFLGENFNPEAFNLEEINWRLRRV
jgi:hypothetical protein